LFTETLNATIEASTTSLVNITFTRTPSEEYYNLKTIDGIMLTLKSA
jgi:hypothetical protein